MSGVPVSWNPAIGLPEAAVLAAVFLLAGVALAWGSSGGARPGLRRVLFGLRLTGLALVAIIWLNPGRWEQDSNSTERELSVLVDRSASMGVEHAPGKSRWTVASEMAEAIRKKATANQRAQIRPFAAAVEEEVETLRGLGPDGSATDLPRAITTVLDQPQPAAGIVILSDGRSTARGKADELGRRARARGVPIHSVVVGGDWGNRDLIVSAVPRRVTAFKGQPVKLAARVENRGLGPIKPVVVLSGPDGKEIARKDVALDQTAPANRATVPFELPNAPDSDGDYTVSVETWPGEQILTNNRAAIRVDVLQSKTRVLLLEGAPYWDSKFLAQLLRQQGAVEILTVHRLNEERYFRVEATGAEPLQSPDTVFPKTAEELRRYDLIVFGKGADGFLDPARATAVQEFVRDQGGAVLFARGKPYGGRFAPAEALESVEWGESTGTPSRFTPIVDESASLFGASLPGPEDSVWAGLPMLEGAHHIAKLKPFARVLAEGTIQGRQTRLPLLVARRHGRGMVATVNADGLWRWDFRADAKETVYQDFWVQLMQWCATYSDFRPGQDYATRLRETTVEPNQPVRAIIAYRGAATPPPKPSLVITRAGKPIAQAGATALPGAEGGREWAAVVSVPEPGQYEIRVVDEARPGKEEGQATLIATAPPKETDDFRPDHELLATLARESGGKSWDVADAEALTAELFSRQSVAAAGKPRWEPLWPKWWVALLVSFVFGAEWWLRRREGLW